jgi:tRNA dimethylallyltransferase
LTIGLQSSLEAIEAAISQRVKARLELGAVQEVQTILGRYPNLKLPAYSATGVKDMLAYLHGTLELEKLAELWSLHEFQYAKRQLTWWKKRTGVTWFEVSEDANPKIMDLVKQTL